MPVAKSRYYSTWLWAIPFAHSHAESFEIPNSLANRETLRVAFAARNALI
jgi:hypothetical protein